MTNCVGKLICLLFRPNHNLSTFFKYLMFAEHKARMNKCKI